MFTLRHVRAPKPNVVLELVVEEHPIKVTFRRMKSIRIMVNPPDGHVTMSHDAKGYQGICAGAA